MSIRQEVAQLVNAGPLPSEGDASEEHLDELARLLEAIAKPVTDEEAQALVLLFAHPDSCFGLAWSLLHLIETAPDAVTADYSRNAENDWVELLEVRRRGVQA